MVHSARALIFIDYTRFNKLIKTEHEPARGNVSQIVHRDEAELKKKLIFLINKE
jgi:hypothetical protein